VQGDDQQRRQVSLRGQAGDQGPGRSARQPEAAGMVRTTMFLGIALTEALALIGFVVFILLKFA